MGDATNPPMPIRVVVGLCLDDKGRVLMAKRGPEQLRPDAWELPGGKIEGSETAENALRREWREELGLLVEVESGSLGEAVLDVEDTFVLSLYRVRIIEIYSDSRPIIVMRLPEYAVKHMPCIPGFYLLYRNILTASMEARRG